MSRSFIASFVRCAACSALVLGSGRAAALDKQGSAHGGSLEGRDEGFDVSGSAFLGTALYNPTYAARPDNTGLALLRYAAHVEVSVWDKHLGVALDTTFFSDRLARNPIAPSEIDVTPELIGRLWRLELHVAYERDMPLDRGGLVQEIVYTLVGFSFDEADAE